MYNTVQKQSYSYLQFQVFFKKSLLAGTKILWNMEAEYFQKKNILDQ